MVEDFCRYKSEESSEFLRFKNPTPTCKMIRRDLVYLNKIRFDEVRASNDDMFSLLTGFSRKVLMQMSVPRIVALFVGGL